MTIKDLAESLGIPQSRLKKLAMELLGCIPSEMSSEDEAKIRRAIASTTQALAAASDNNLIPSEKALSPQQESVREILGESIVKKLVRDYLFSLKEELNNQKFQADSLIFQSEQAFYSNLAAHQQTAQNESLERVKKNANYYNMEGIKSLSSSDCTDDLLTEIAELMAAFAGD